ncbi:MAG TPA: DUF2817 domain-containing protein [Candidatus Saccharimonadales bacterium]
MPNLVAKKQGSTFAATPSKNIAIAGYPIYSRTTCIAPTQAPAENFTDNIAFSPINIGFLKKSIHVSAGTLPAVNYSQAMAVPLATKDPITFPLDSTDKFFEYQLLANGQKALCSKKNKTLVCDTSKLSLEQSASYVITMERLFNGKSHATVFEQTATTVGAVQIVSSSIAAGQTVYDAPSQMTLTLNKEIKTFSDVELHLTSGQVRQKIPTTANAEGATITVRFSEPLARSSSFELTVKTVAAPDGGHLPAPVSLGFTTSGGPKVKGVSVGSYKVAVNSNIVVTFDSNISIAQALGQFIKIEVGGSAIAAEVSVNGNRATINPSSDLPKCTNFTVRVLDGLQNEAGIAGGSAWSYKSRSMCQTAFTIGTSVQNRSITAYRFGSGGSYVVFVGGTHGDEKSSTHTLNSFVDYLESHGDQIPANRTVVVIPNLNPDGYAKSQRVNANNVDLNRNFPANSWKQSVTMPGGTYNANGGGSAPLSEPESRSLANYILSVNPQLVLTYHAAAGVVIPNDSGDSVALAKTYDSKSNLNYASNSQTGTIFNYDTTGAFEDWLHDKYSIPALLIELWTKSSNEFTKNQNAMWHMATLP